jgi:hypothetical protein
MDQAIERVLAAWRLSAARGELGEAASEGTIAEAERALGRPVPYDLKVLYRFSNGMGPLGGNLAVVPLHDTEHADGEEIGLVNLGDRLRSWDWPIPDEVLVFGGNGGDDQFGIWYPSGAPADGPTPVVMIGSIFEPGCLALAGTDLPKFLLAWSGYYLALLDAPTEALDALGLPDSLRRIDKDGSFAPYFRWADPSLPDPVPDPYSQRMDAEEIAAVIEDLRPSGDLPEP